MSEREKLKKRLDAEHFTPPSRSETAALLSELEQAERERDAAMRGLESLTPSGSEFVNDVKRCVEHVRERMSSQWELAKKYKLKSDASEAALRTLRQASAAVSQKVNNAVFVTELKEEINALRLAAEGGK